jgi:predicted PurR-regulated permease PerM
MKDFGEKDAENQKTGGPTATLEIFDRTFTAIFVFTVIFVFLYLIRNILLPFVISGIVAFVCSPAVDWISMRIRVPRWLAAVGVLLLIFALTALFGYLGAPALTAEARKITADLRGTIETLVKQLIGDGSLNLLGQSVNAKQITDYIATALRDWLSGPQLLLVGGFAFAAMFGIILTFVLLAYFLIGGPSIAKGLFWLVPPKNRPFAYRVWDDLHQVLWRYFVGVALVVLYASVVAYIGLGVILGIDHAVFLALLTGVLEIIPVAGPLVSAVIAGLVAVQEAAGAWNIIAYVIYAIVLRISIDEFFGPIVLGRAAYFPPVLVIFCFLTGGILFGITGVIMAVPVALTIKAILCELYKENEAMGV